MPVEHNYLDVPMLTSLIIEPILPQHRGIVMKLMKKHGERLGKNEVFFHHELKLTVTCYNAI